MEISFKSYIPSYYVYSYVIHAYYFQHQLLFHRTLQLGVDIILTAVEIIMKISNSFIKKELSKHYKTKRVLWKIYIKDEYYVWTGGRTHTHTHWIMKKRKGNSIITFASLEHIIHIHTSIRPSPIHLSRAQVRSGWGWRHRQPRTWWEQGGPQQTPAIPTAQGPQASPSCSPRRRFSRPTRSGLIWQWLRSPAGCMGSARDGNRFVLSHCGIPLQFQDWLCTLVSYTRPERRRRN